MTLYSHFPGKDDLILAVLQYPGGGVPELVRSGDGAAVEAGEDPIGALFSALKEWFETPISGLRVHQRFGGAGRLRPRRLRPSSGAKGAGSTPSSQR